MDELIKAVRAYAEANYGREGWDVVVECWDNADIAEMIFHCSTPAQAIECAREFVAAREEQCFEAQACSGELDHYGIETGPDGNLRRKDS